MHLTLNYDMLIFTSILLVSRCNFVFTQQLIPAQQPLEQKVTNDNAPTDNLPAESRSLPDPSKLPIFIGTYDPSAVTNERSGRSFLSQKLNIFSGEKNKNRDQDAMMGSHSIPMARFAPFSFATPSPAPFLAGQRSPFASFMIAAPSNPAMSYFNPFTFGSFDPYANIARRVAAPNHPRAPYLPLSPGQIPTYFPLGSMVGTPIMDPSLGSALASTLSNRYSQNPFGPMAGSSLYGSSLYEDPYDSMLLASALKRYFKSGRGRVKERDEMRTPSDYSYDKFEHTSTGPRYNEGYSRDNRRATFSNRFRDSDYPKYTSNSYDHSTHPKGGYRNYDSHSASNLESIAPVTSGAAQPSQASSIAGRSRERSRDSNEAPYVDMYGWSGSGKPFSKEPNQRNQQSDLDDGRQEDRTNRQPLDRYGYDSPTYGSRNDAPSVSTYKDSVNRNDLDAV